MSSVRTNTIGKYHLTKLVGQGGMGSVYIATDTVLGRQVAVKVLHSHLCRSAEMLERFRNEAVTHAKLEHANIVRLYDFLTEEGLSLIAMEYVPGGRNLGDLIEHGPMPQRGAWRQGNGSAVYVEAMAAPEVHRCRPRCPSASPSNVTYCGFHDRARSRAQVRG